ATTRRFATFFELHFNSSTGAVFPSRAQSAMCEKGQLSTQGGRLKATSSEFVKRSNRGVPSCGYPTIAIAIFLDVAHTREREMVSLYANFISGYHVVELATRLLGQGPVHVKQEVPIRLFHKECSHPGGNVYLMNDAV